MKYYEDMKCEEEILNVIQINVLQDKSIFLIYGVYMYKVIKCLELGCYMYSQVKKKLFVDVICSLYV